MNISYPQAAIVNINTSRFISLTFFRPVQNREFFKIQCRKKERNFTYNERSQLFIGSFKVVLNEQASAYKNRVLEI